MKYTLFIVLILFYYSLFAQNYIPIPVDSTSVWRIERGYTFGGNCADIYNSTYYVDGTIIHNDKEYFLIYESGEFYQVIAHPPGPCNESYTYEGIYRGAIRSENGKTYSLNSSNEENLLLDFTLNVGDTLNSSISYGLVIESVDSVLVGDEYRKRFNFTAENICSWMIEGVGHELGLFEPMNIMLDFASSFLCYGENNMTLFGDMNCELHVGFEEIELDTHDLKIYPNPTFDKLTVDFIESTNKITSCRIIDVFGNIVYNQQNIQIINGELIIDLKDLNPGLYILSFNINNKDFIFRKVVKE